MQVPDGYERSVLVGILSEVLEKSPLVRETCVV